LLDEGRATTVRDAERQFPVRIKIAVPPEALGGGLDQIIAWLDANCGADWWISTPSSTRGVVNDALAIYFADITLATAFVARWVRRTEGPDCGWDESGPRQRTYAARWGGSAQDTLNAPLYHGGNRSGGDIRG